jgi:hypothetical protein
MSERDPERFEDQDRSRDRYDDGFIEGFSRSREIFWRDLMRRAGECRLMSESTDSQTLREHLAAMDVAYRNAADIVSRAHTLYPGSLPKDASHDDPRFTVKYEGNLYRY